MSGVLKDAGAGGGAGGLLGGGGAGGLLGGGGRKRPGRPG